MKKEEVKLILENQQVIMNALGNMTHNFADLKRLQEQFIKTIPFVHGKQVVKHGK